MSEQKKKRQRIYDLLNAETKLSFFVYRLQSKEEKNYRKRASLGKGEWRFERETKRRLFNCSRYGD